MLSGGSSSNGPPNFGAAANAAAVAASVGTAAAVLGAPFGGALSAVGGAIAGVAAATGEGAVDQALSAPEVNVEAVKEKVERDPSLWRREGETFQEWVKRLGVFSLIDDVHEQRRFQLRAAYTDKVIARDARRSEELDQLQSLYERFTDKPSNTPLPTGDKRSDVLLGQPIKI